MKKKSLRTLRSGRTRRRTLLLSRKTKVRRGLARKPRRGLSRKIVRYGKTKKGLLVRKKRRLRRKLVRKVRVIQAPVHVVPVIEAPPAPQVIPLPGSWRFAGNATGRRLSAGVHRSIQRGVRRRFRQGLRGRA